MVKDQVQSQFEIEMQACKLCTSNGNSKLQTTISSISCRIFLKILIFFFYSRAGRGDDLKSSKIYVVGSKSDEQTPDAPNRNFP